MKKTLDKQKIARALGAERRGKVAAPAGYFGARALLADVEARLGVPAGGGRPTDPGWTERRLVPLARGTLEKLKSTASRVQEKGGARVEPMQLAAILIEKGLTITEPARARAHSSRDGGKAMVDLQGLYRGFVRSYAGLLLPAGEDQGNPPQETHAITEHFRRLGLALGYWPWCEGAKRHDLDWYESNKTVAVHFEFENRVDKAEDAVKRLLGSQARQRVAYVWLRQNQVERVENLLKKAGKVPTLIMARVSPGRGKGRAQGNAYRYEVKAWLLDPNGLTKLSKATLVYPQLGFVRMEGEEDANW